MSEVIIDAETQPSQAVIVRPEQQVAHPGLFGTTNPAEVIAKASEVATALKDVVKRQGLVSNINGKEYPKCEAWTLLGTMLGVFPVMCWTKKLENGWEARVEARTKDGAIVGAAEAECLKSEKNWSNRDDFAIRSMAQTRATAKCLRMPLGFVMTLAGYEATPAEEMVSGPHEGPQTKRGSPDTHPPAKTQPAPASAKLPPSVVNRRKKFIENLEAAGLRDKAMQYLIDIGWLMSNEPLEKMEDRFVPVTAEHYTSFLAKLLVFSGTGKAERPFEPPPTAEIGHTPDVPRGTVNVSRDKNIDCNSPDAPWRSFPVPFGKHAGTKLADLDKNVLWGFWANYKVEKQYVGKNGQTYQTKPEKLAKDKLFREMLDEAGRHYEFTKKEEDEEGDDE